MAALRFQGQQYDEESGLNYNRYRYYQKEMIRYITQDPIGLNGDINNYSYAKANPLSFIDPLGLIHGIPLENVRILTPKPQPPVNDPCVQKYLTDNYGGALAKAINFGNVQQYIPNANPNASQAIEEGMKIGGEKMAIAKGPGIAGNALMRAYPGSLSLGYSLGAKLTGLSTIVSGTAEVAGAFLMPFGSVAMIKAREACSCEN
ncbi:RHS repeat-associated core domain-containing protein [Diaphorobacter aerolatus]|uniref:RHS repeat-associated core domain-containing protein n=1 Tax=Diaphorobacter aerolatus TaxID=1288495 RepID=A0A7H0GQ08_9BURK|nr:RHS repeat-associated core domain-containing protein [Diaphorobacter aerolatus]QNP50374.1 RHS repeat-associated core domain-containing protein [Diaphorobacter aerolatus]